MINTPKEIQKYLIPARDTFWMWDEEGEVIVWSNKMTLLFRQELIEITEHLASGGLPPIELLLLLMAMLREGFQDNHSVIDIIKEINCTYPAIDVANKQFKPGDLYSALALKFSKIQQLSKELRTSNTGKKMIAEVVFESATNKTSPALAESIVAYLKTGIGEDVFQNGQERDSYFVSEKLTIKNISDFLKGLDQLETDKLKLRIETGLETLPDPIDLDVSFATHIRNLISELKNDEEFNTLGTMAQKLLGAITLPRPVSEPDDMTLGGVSDISNRGPLDRLLLSELANDDTVLAARIANNEAMYMRRETTPQPPNQCRTLLIDCGIHTWGIPRVYISSVALALAATLDPDSEFNAYRVVKDGLKLVDLSTKEGIKELLISLDTYLHPSFAIPEFLHKMELIELDPEPVLIITDESWNDIGFQRALNKNSIEKMFIATVKRDGQLQIFEKSPRGVKSICDLTLNLDEIMSGSKSHGSLITKDLGAENLPAIFSVHPFPLLIVSHFRQGNKSVWRVPDYGQLSLTKYGQLLYWSQSARGAQLLTTLDYSIVYWKNAYPVEGCVSFVCGNISKNELQLVHVDLKSLEITCIHLDFGLESFNSICAHNGFLFVVDRSSNRYAVLDIVEGEKITISGFSTHFDNLCDRFFKDRITEKWYALTYSPLDSKSTFPEIKLSLGTSNKIVSIFERDPDVGPVCVLKGDRGLYFTARDQFKKLPISIFSSECFHVSADGRKVALNTSREKPCNYNIYDVQSMKFQQFFDNRNVNLALERIEGWKEGSVNIRKKFIGMALSKRGQLIFKSSKEYYLQLCYNDHADKIQLKIERETKIRITDLKTFKLVKLQVNIGFDLSVATWEDGSQAFLDSRGMVHLQSSNPEIPEVTLVLGQDEISGWCSDGRFWGQQYFCGDNPVCEPEEIFNSVIKPFVDQLS